MTYTDALSWSTTLCCNVHDFWTCVQEELLLPLTICLKVSSILIYNITPILIKPRVYALVNPHLCDLPLFTMADTCLATTLTQWEGSTKNNGNGIYQSIFTLGDFVTWPQSPLDWCLRTSCIFMSLSLTMTSMIKQRQKNESYTNSELHQPPYF